MGKILGVTDDSRKVVPGWVFVAIKGLTVDGHDYIDDAFKKGASAVYGEVDFPNPKYIKVKDSRQKFGELVSEFYGNPSSKLKIIGVTGTDGKTTTSSLIYHILKKNGKKVGLVSTVSAKIGDSEYDTGFHVTNPGPEVINKFLAKMAEQNFEYAVLEVTSHGIDQKRIAGIKFDICVITNITKEHLDYHKTYKNYRNVKLSFLKTAKETVFINKDDISYDFLKRNLEGKYKYYERTSDISGILPGIYNESNAAAAIKVVENLGISRKDAISAVKSFEFPDGRLTEIKNDLGVKIYVDFAHTPNALESVLTYLKNETKGRLISVFGCASERDIKKRPLMARISCKLADVSVFTVEDSRYEDVYKIFEPMKRAARRLGKVKNKDFYLVPERGEAIALALSLAKKGDIVGIFGKGHEKSLSYKGFEHPWSDRKAVENYLARDKGITSIILAAGKGSRMKSKLPKILHEICGRPMIAYSLQNLRAARVGEIIAVVSFKRNMVKRRIFGATKIAIQSNPKGGTGDAVRSALPLVSENSKYVMVFYGDDSAFFKSETITNQIDRHIKDDAVVSFSSTVVENPFGLGRVLRDSKGKVLDLIEEKVATDEQKKINEINCGNFIFNKNWLIENIDKLAKSPSGEYYINNLVQAAIDQGRKVSAYKLNDRWEWQGINTPEQLELANKKMKERLDLING